MDLSAGLAAYDRVALNLDKLDWVWQRMRRDPPPGLRFRDGGHQGRRQSSEVRCEPAIGPICSIPPSTTHDAPVT